MKSYLKILGSIAIVLFLALPFAANAQQTSSVIAGVVTDVAGNPIANSLVTVRDEGMGVTRTARTDAAGKFRVRNLPIGYDYTVSATSSGFGTETIEGLSVNLGRVASVNFALAADDGSIEEVSVTGTKPLATQVALGPSATFGLLELEAAPNINRNITDVIRADARIYVDESRGNINAVQCGGKNPRYNSLTVDGVRMNDSFGLNSNGYPTERMPFSYDAIQQVAVEMAPFDVQYGGFSACNINAVTKSGGNKFSGSAFYDYTGDSLRSDKLEGDNIDTGDYTEERYGITIGGPIIKDKLFFFAAYEKLDGANLFDRGPIGSGAVNEVMVTQAELDEIADIARTLYLYDPGITPTSMPHEDEKLLVKLDWNINDQHRMAFTYTYNDGENFTQADGDQNEFEFSNHLYERGAELNSYAATLYSDWTDTFSTEFRVSYLDIDNRQITVGPVGFGEIRVELDDVDVYLGGDDSRQANKLAYDVTSFALKGNWDLDRHSLTFGVEREALEVFNMFVQHTNTEIRFNSIDLFRAGLADDLYYNNAPSNNPQDAAAVWGYDVNSVYAQDDFQVTDRVSLVLGLRYDWYTTSDAPLENADFVADYGFSNSTNLDGEGLLQPRFGISIDVSDQTVVRGGVGIYSGGNPNVWLSNNFSANNVLQFGQRGRSFCFTDSFRGPCGTPPVQISLLDPSIVWRGIEANAPAGAGAGWGVPTELFDAVAAGVGDNFEINYLDPDFDLPQELKFAVGITHIFKNDWVFNADVLITQGDDDAMVLHGDLEQTGTDADGYPEYDSVREASFVLTNSRVGANSRAWSVGLNKSWEHWDFSAGYAHSDTEDVQPMTSSVAFSNYQNRAFFDPQEDVASTSNYNIEHRVTFTTTWRKDFFNRFPTVMSLYGSANSGRPYSISFNGTISPFGFTPFLDFRDNVLLPTEGRNAQESSWWTKLDLRIDVGIPVFREDDRASVFLVVDNLTNLLNDSWGILKQHNFPRTVTEGTNEPRIGDASRYEIRFGIKYAF